MSSEALPVGMSSDSEDLRKAKVEVQAKARFDDSNTMYNTYINLNGIEIDSVSSGNKVVLIPPSKQISSETAKIASLVFGNTLTRSAGEQDNAFVVQMTVGTSIKEKSLLSPLYSQSSLTRQNSLLRRGSSLSRQESWRTKSSRTRTKNRKNYISYHNITYTVPQGWFFQKKKPPKVILNNIRLVAIAIASISRYSRAQNK